ncbi:CAP domain-containing protein [Actinoplanes sp. NPDC051343]|uniref:CAP domain-containing protein n=1 Tax=Actinoplanes sp. NPDC051343 TaxID=3363906 RepID=UPI0037B5BDCB
MLAQVLRRLALLGAAPLLLVLTTPAQAVTSLPPVTPVPARLVSPIVLSQVRLMSQVVTMTNQQRHANGCGLLTVSHDLTIASVRQSLYMARTGLFTHVWRDGSTFVTRAHAAGYRQPSGENIAWGYQTAADVMAAWMASPHHRENILNCGARSIGTGVIYAANGIPYYTEVFGWD